MEDNLRLGYLARIFKVHGQAKYETRVKQIPPKRLLT
jgi:hypothetical protein